MLDPSHPMAELLRKDRRYKLGAYLFVFEALNYAQNVMRLGREVPSEEAGTDADDEDQPERHVTGQELCEAIRRYALEQYGYMAKTVLANWGVHCTGDFGEIVFNLIQIRQMRKTPTDRREDFDEVFNFDDAFRTNFRIRPTEAK